MSRRQGDLFNFEISYHRNGIAGNGFYAVRFNQQIENRGNQAMFAVVFEEPGNIAVFELTGLAADDLDNNKQRGDDYEKKLREEIQKYEEES